MAHKNKVVKSINYDGEMLCVDIFVRPDDTFGFEEYRRDIEDNRGWFPIGFYADRVFHSVDDALADAIGIVPWLSDALRNH